MPGRSTQKLKKELFRVTREELTCKPLDSRDEIMNFLENPPPWRTLCEELRPHSKEAVNNMNRLQDHNSSETSVESMVDYCHFDPDCTDPLRDVSTVKEKPKTLVCHDFANGYHDDSHIDGTTNYDAYTFYNWAGIDIFCYFSHHLITIPPLGWINVGHAHGVKVIGTIITEWAEGTAFWDVILESEASYQEFASAVVAIAKTLKFDGWLLNIENKVSKPDVLLKFVTHLHQVLHSELVDPELIWYDSVTINGNLNWQNGLNEKNKPYFDVCDGFFVNYSWSLKDIKNSVVAAGNRITDVYVGIDIWGRNFYSGGQFNSFQAVKAVYNEGCSLAIFAPAWTYEAMTMEPDDMNYVINGGSLDRFETFLLRDRALWTTLWPYLYTSLPCHLPFQTSFCRGLGKRRFMYGETISHGPWYNLRMQQYQPNSMLGTHCYTLRPYVAKKEKEPKEPKRLTQDIQTEAPLVESTNPLELKESFQKNLVVDSLTRIAREKSPPTVKTTNTEQEVENAPVVSKEPDVHEKPAIKESKKKKSLLRRIRSLFLKCSCREPEVSNVSYYEAEKVVAHSTVETNAIPGTSYVKESSDKEKSSKPSSFSKEQSAVSSVSNSPTSSVKASSRATAEVEVQKERQLPDNPETELTKCAITETELTKCAISETEATTEYTQGPRASFVSPSIRLDLKHRTTKMRWALKYKPQERQCLTLFLDDAYIGGACLKVYPSDSVNTWHRMTRLFHCDLKCDNALILCVVTKRLVHSPNQSLNVRLKMRNAEGKDLRVVLVGRNLDLETEMNKDSEGIRYCYPLHSETQSGFQKLREYLLVHQPGFYMPIQNIYRWEVRYYKVHVPQSRVVQINCRTELPEGGILFGYLGICHQP